MTGNMKQLFQIIKLLKQITSRVNMLTVYWDS
jgi:hypothetical protein